MGIKLITETIEQEGSEFKYYYPTQKLTTRDQDQYSRVRNSVRNAVNINLLF